MHQQMQRAFEAIRLSRLIYALTARWVLREVRNARIAKILIQSSLM